MIKQQDLTRSFLGGILRTVSGLIANIRRRLEKKGISSEASESMLVLLSALFADVPPANLQDEKLLDQLVEALADNGNLLSLIQQQAAELDALKRIAFNLTTSLDLQAVLNGVVEEAMRLVRDAHDAHIFLHQDRKLVFGASIKADGSKNEPYAEPRPNGLTAKVAQSGEMLVIPDMRKHPLYRSSPDTWSGSIIAIPLKMGSRVIGVMNLARNRTGEFTESEIRLLCLLADQAAVAIINARLHSAVSQQARSDMLTGLPNRRALDERLDDEIKRSERSGRVFCVIMMDLDGFKQINDTYGHDVGDEVLRQIARSLQENLRASDFLARYGGDELTLVLTETTLTQAQIVVDKISRNLESLVIQLTNKKTTKMSLSGGIAIYPKHAKNAPGLLRAADEALYHAKRSGGKTFQVVQNADA